MKTRTITHFVSLAVALLFGAFSSPAHAQLLGSNLPLLTANRFVLVVPQGGIPFTKAAGLEGTAFFGNASRPGNAPAAQVPRTVTLTGPSGSASAITQQWLSSQSSVFLPQDLVLRQLTTGGALVRTYQLRNVVPVQWSVAGFNAGNASASLETLQRYCGGGVVVGDVAP